MQVGIDKISFYTSSYFLDLATLAETLNKPLAKFYHNLGQYKMAIPPPSEDVITMAANAADQILTPEDKKAISVVMFATETGIDQSKAAGIYVHNLLGLPTECRVIELKQACYAATFGLQSAMALLKVTPQTKILLLASDIARYELNSPAESSQGCGAIAMLLSAKPRVLAIEPEAGFITEDVMDFWRPNYRDNPLVFGKYSCEVYLRILEKTWQNYTKFAKRKFSDHQGFCYHVPVPKLVETAHKRLLDLNRDDVNSSILPLELSLKYNREVGNGYTASLYLSLLSLLENNSADLANYRLGLYSYGSGCVGEYFSGIVQPNYQQAWLKTHHQACLAKRTELDYSQYLDFYNFKLPTNGEEFNISPYFGGKFYLSGIKDHQRVYLSFP